MTDYSYQNSGFDGFLSRSIDNLTQTTLDSPGPDSKQIRFDSAQLSGYIGNALKTPDIDINASDGAIIKNGQLDVYDDSGNQSIFNGAPYEKLIYATFEYDVNVLASTNYVTQNFAHGLSKTPYVTGSVQTIVQGDFNEFTWRPLPMFFHSNKSYYGLPPYSASIVIEYVDDVVIQCRLDIIDAFGLSFFNSRSLLKMIFYCYLNPRA